ncbi:MAG: molybdenum cofactor biosynthesis protein MoaE [Devosiaceae bacterium]|nr:molybdenum cofactor biosynthesis protein MoaE [Devosiaceae bacterium]
MSATIHASLTSDKINIQNAYDFVADDAHGAIDVFVGTVRNLHEGQNVLGITYDAHEGLAKNVFTQICLEAQSRWQGAKIYLSHYNGELDIGGISIIIAVSSAHRANSFEACRYIIEEIKKRAPVWKQEHYENGCSEWLPGHSLNEANSE